jgi:hypothetical protein
MGRSLALIAVVAAALSWPVGAAVAAPPQIVSVGVGGVTATGATLRGSIDPEGSATTFRFEYLTEVAYEANLGAEPPRDPFAGAALIPENGEGFAGAGTSPSPVNGQSIKNLASATAYRFRLRAQNSLGETAFSVARPFTTEASTNVFELLDHRRWEMVSPIEKSGGAIQPPGAISGGGIFQAAARGGSVTFSSTDPFGEGAQGAPSGSQYLAARTGVGWVSANITTPLLSGSYGSEPDGVPYQLFSEDLGFGLLSNGERCRGIAGGECPVANPPLPGSGAPPGYRDYYRRTSSGGFESILTGSDLVHTSLGPEGFELRLVATTSDLSHLVLSTCAALTGDAVEVSAPGGCDPAAQNLYEWSGGSLSLINLLPGETTGTPGATIAASSGAISSDGSRVYFVSGGDVYLRERGVTKPVLGTPGGKFEAASTTGAVAYLVASEQLVRYSAQSGTVTSLTTGGGVEGVLGVSSGGATVYFVKSGAVFMTNGAALTEVAPSAAPSDWPAATGTARVSPDGSHLLFLSEAELTGYPNEGEAEAFLYGPPPGSHSARLVCVSCDPSGESPNGPGTIPGARPNGVGVDAIDIYKPRSLSGSGNRVFFETPDVLVQQDTNEEVDVYEWEAGGEGTCGQAAGCVQLISGGREAAASYFLDADEAGGESFFLTAASLYPLDPGSYDVYVAREFGGFAVPEQPIPCTGDSCQILPDAPEDPSPGTLAPSSGNPTLKVVGSKGKAKKKKRKHRRKHSGRHAHKKGGKKAGKKAGGRRR